MVRSDLVVLIPAFNEEETIAEVVSSLKNFGDILVVNDGSLDKTELNAINAGANTISHIVNQGYDKALNTGFKYAYSMKYKYLITLDADKQHPVDKLESIYKELVNGADLVLGCRNKKQRISEYIFSFYTRLRWGIKDPLTGFKGYRMSLYEELGHFDSYNSIGTELSLFAARKKKIIKQFMIETNDRKGDARFGNSISSNLRILMSMINSLR